MTRTLPSWRRIAFVISTLVSQVACARKRIGQWVVDFAFLHHTQGIAAAGDEYAAVPQPGRRVASANADRTWKRREVTNCGIEEGDAQRGIGEDLPIGQQRHRRDDREGGLIRLGSDSTGLRIVEFQRGLSSACDQDTAVRQQYSHVERASPGHVAPSARSARHGIEYFRAGAKQRRRHVTRTVRGCAARDEHLSVLQQHRRVPESPLRHLTGNFETLQIARGFRGRGHGIAAGHQEQNKNQRGTCFSGHSTSFLSVVKKQRSAVSIQPSA